MAFELAPQSRQKLSDLVEQSGADSMSEVVRKSLELYKYVLDTYEREGETFVEFPDGTRERLRVL